MEPAVWKSPRNTDTPIAVPSRTGTSILRFANVFNPFVMYFTERMAVRVFAIGTGKNIRLMHRIKTLSTSFSLYSSFTCLPEFAR